MRLCPKCSTIVSEESRTCGVCGADLWEAQKPVDSRRHNGSPEGQDCGRPASERKGVGERPPENNIEARFLRWDGGIHSLRVLASVLFHHFPIHNRYRDRRNGLRATAVLHNWSRPNYASL